jgi:hypothetical protein
LGLAKAHAPVARHSFEEMSPVVETVALLVVRRRCLMS